MAQCGIKEKNKPVCNEELFKHRGRLYCPVHCRAKTGRGPCKRHHVKDGRRCDLHGGKSPKGLASPNTKTGEHSRYLGVLSPQMRDRMEQRAKDLNKLSLEAELDLLHMRVEVLIERMKEGESWASWHHALEAFEKFADAQSEKKRDEAIEALQQLGAILRRGVQAEKDWSQIDQLAWVRKPRLVETEVKRAQVMAEIIHRNFVMQIFQVIAEGVKRRVKDLPPATAAEIITGVQSDIKRLAGGGYSEAVHAGGDDD
jgi:hypothetical protein